MRKHLFQISNLANRLFSKEVNEAVMYLKKIEKSSVEDFLAHRNLAFQKLIEHCYEQVPYYKDYMKQQDIIPSDIQTIKDIKLFPVLTKNIIRKEGSRLLAKNLKQFSYISRRSGGTTGEPVKAYVDRHTQALETYSFLRGLQWMGWKPGQKIIKLSGGSLGITQKRKFKVNLRNLAMNQAILPAFDINFQSAQFYLDTIQNLGPCIIIGYASALLNLARVQCEQRYNLNVDFVFSTAELLPPDWAETISEAFGCEVKCYYGCGEIESLGYQTAQGGIYTIPDDVNYLEISNTEHELPQNSLLLTSLFNRAMPFLRYANGDLASGIISSSFDKRRSAIKELNGRSVDMFTDNTGTAISGSFGPHLIYKTNLRVSKYQFIQSGIGKIVFRYDLDGEDLNKEEKRLLNDTLENILGGSVEIEFIRTKEFILSKNRKHRIVINHIS